MFAQWHESYEILENIYTIYYLRIDQAHCGIDYLCDLLSMYRMWNRIVMRYIYNLIFICFNISHFLHIFEYILYTSLAPMCITMHRIFLSFFIASFIHSNIFAHFLHLHFPPMLAPQCISIPVYSLWLLYTLYICGHFSCFSRFVPLPLALPLPQPMPLPLPLFLFCLCFMTDCLCSQRVRSICQVFFSIFIPFLVLLIHICIRFFVVVWLFVCLSVCGIHILSLWIAWAYFTDNKFKKR